MPGTFSYNYGANPSIDVVRLLIADTVQYGADGVTPVWIFADQEIQMAATYVCPAFAIVPSGGGQATTFGQSSYRFTAAALLESLAANKARLANALKVLDIQMNVQAASKELKDLANQLREAEQNDGSFAIVEQCVDAFSQRERLWKQMLRLQS